MRVSKGAEGELDILPALSVRITDSGASTIQSGKNMSAPAETRPFEAIGFNSDGISVSRSQRYSRMGDPIVIVIATSTEIFEPITAVVGSALHDRWGFEPSGKPYSTSSMFSAQTGHSTSSSISVRSDRTPDHPHSGQRTGSESVMDYTDKFNRRIQEMR